VILPLVRSNSPGEIGFLGTKDGLQRLNVAYSRAQEKLIIIGDFTHTLTRANPRGGKNRKWNKNIERSLDVFVKTVEYAEKLKSKFDLEKEDTPNIGGTLAENESVVNPSIQSAIQNGDAIKMFFLNKKPVFYKVRYVSGYQGESILDVGRIVRLPFNEKEAERLKRYMKLYYDKYRNETNIQTRFEDIKIGILKGRAFAGPGTEETYSIVHTGRSTATIWFGELFLKELLKDENRDDAEYIFDHEIKHILIPLEAEEEHQSIEYKERVKELKKKCELLRARYMARDLFTQIKNKAYKIPEKKELILALDDSWVPDKDGVSGVLRAIRKMSGEENITIIRARGNELAKKIKQKVIGDDYSNVVVLASEETLKTPEFDDIKGAGKKPCMVTVDPENIIDCDQVGKENYIRIVEMIKIAMYLAFGDKDIKMLANDYPFVDVLPSKENPRMFTFIPLAEPVDIGELVKLYRAQEDVITSL